MKVLVIGAAVSGRAALRLLEAEGHEVIMYDGDTSALVGLEGERRVHGGAWDPGLLAGIEQVVVSPGVPERAAPIAATIAAGIPIWSEIELASRRIGVPYAAVTGTNGKTTVSDLTAAMLAESGLRTAAVGNIGVPLADAAGREWDALVVEASSFQLRFIVDFHPRVAVLLNVAPDHLDWHGDFEAYLEAKARIWENQGPDDALVFDTDDAGAVRAVAGAVSRAIPVSGIRIPPGGAGPAGDVLEFPGGSVPVRDLDRADRAYLVDVAAAAVAAVELGGEPAAVARAAAGFRSARHRRELIAAEGGITWVDDSKATNPHAALAAIAAYPSVVLIAGGRNKGLEVAPLARAGNVRFVVGLGEAGPEIVAEAAEGEMARDMAQAVEIARRVARPGDTVLLAPGCASFDMFESYAARGAAFAAAVREEG